ncbi:Uncharacterised protein [Citrobacter koseri]|uniref:Uncharacterized protein n=1 Tax=Citrobacter koseri TaxID=545 RepID=A0A447UJG8_CITKO|nr:Uncharacterised protein [Citrobacter koseri]
MAQAFMAHFHILNGIDIRYVRQPDAAANQLGAAKADGVRPDFFRNSDA